MAECWVCLEGGGDEPLVRSCACRGQAGFAHIRCLIASAQHDWRSWWACPTCKQNYTGAVSGAAALCVFLTSQDAAAQVQIALARAWFAQVEGRSEDDDERLSAASCLAQALHQSVGDFEGAQRLFASVLRVQRRTKGDDNEATLTSIFSLVNCQRMLRDAPDNLALAEEALKTARRVKGAVHHQTLNAMSLLAEVYADNDKLSQALPLARKSLYWKRLTLGNDHFDTLISIAGLGALYSDLNELLKAQPLLEEDLASSRRLLGADHPATLTSMSNLATLRCDQGHKEEGLELMKAAVQGFTKVLGAAHPSTKMSIEDLAEYEGTA